MRSNTKFNDLLRIDDLAMRLVRIKKKYLVFVGLWAYNYSLKLSQFQLQLQRRLSLP